MSSKERYQNPTCGDTLNLRMFTYNSNNKKDIESIESIDIYVYDDHGQGRLIQTIEGSEVSKTNTGEYLLELNIEHPLYIIGKYQDVWNVTFENEECAVAKIVNRFQIYPDLWFTTTVPPVYDFNFDFRPNKIRKGSKRYIIIEISPNVPNGSDIAKYYENLAIVSDIKVSIEIECGNCVPQEEDLRLIVDKEVVDYRERCYAYYFINTENYEEGIYNIWFELSFGENLFISEKNSFQVYN